MTSANKKLKPYRQELTNTVILALHERSIEKPFAAKHVPVSIVMDFYIAKPPSIPKKRTDLVVKPDLDKLVRATTDSLTGLLYADDAQIIEYSVRKHYGTPERAEISATILAGSLEVAGVQEMALFSTEE